MQETASVQGIRSRKANQDAHYVPSDFRFSDTQVFETLADQVLKEKRQPFQWDSLKTLRSGGLLIHGVFQSRCFRLQLLCLLMILPTYPDRRNDGLDLDAFRTRLSRTGSLVQEADHSTSSRTAEPRFGAGTSRQDSDCFTSLSTTES
jgi:hypothetical protein